MKEHKRTEEQQKDYILDLFSKCRNETVSNQLQGDSLKLCEQIYLWYKDYLSVDVNNIGLGLVEVIIRFTKNISKIPKDKDGFFKYLSVSINNEKAGYYRKYNENDTIKIPREKKRKLREIKDFIRMKESQLERKLTNDEQIQSISKWFKKQEYIDLWNSINVGSISYTSNDGNDEIDVLNKIDNHSIDPLDEELINKVYTQDVIEAVEFLLEKKQKRSRDCYRALFTLYCIENIKDFKALCPVLDKSIIEACKKDDKKDSKNPNQYEIYKKYHEKAQKSSAEVMASTNLREFLNDIDTYIKEKNR